MAGAGGENLGRFADALIHAEAQTGGLSLSAVHTQVRANIPDGGVDTRVDQPVPGDTSGWLQVPTIWQYKAEEARKLTEAALREEITKPHAVDLIKRGYAYRLCVASDLSSPKCEKLELVLQQAARSINTDCPAPRVVAIDQLSAWASRYPFVAGMVRSLPLELLNSPTWAQGVTHVTPTYVKVPEWQGHHTAILAHTDFASPVHEPCLIVEGEAGVGKTRLVYEALASRPSANAMVGYCANDGKACEIAAWLAINPTATGILVVDECSHDTRMKLGELLRGHASRIRVIVIEHSGRREKSDVAQIWLERLPGELLREVLARNFPHVPVERRAVYADLAGGFVRFAADLCGTYVPGVDEQLGPALRSVSDRLRWRLSEDQLSVLQALALFPRIGFRDDVKDELDALVLATGIAKRTFEDAVRQTKDAPGFIAVAGRFWYVTPAIVAKVSYSEAWSRYVGSDLPAFVAALPGSLVRGFLERAAAYGNEEVKSAVSNSFRDWLGHLTIEQLADSHTAELTATVTEADPDRALPSLRAVIESAPDGSLASINGHLGVGTRGARRHLVWLCERMAAFPEWFHDAETILYRLALEESEPNIGNNATEVWTQLFQVHLSGTAVPFRERLTILQERLQSTDSRGTSLAVAAIDKLLSERGFRVTGRTFVSGRMLPPDWQPSSRREAADCIRQALSVLGSTLRSTGPIVAQAAFDLVIKNVGSLVGRGFLDEIQAMLDGLAIDESRRAKLLQAIDEFISFRVGRPGPNASPQWLEYLNRVASWADTLRPTQFAERLRTLISRNTWDVGVRDEAGEIAPQVRALAREVIEDPSKLDGVVTWLNTEDAKSAPVFGAALAERDVGGVFIAPILEATIATGSGALARGYAYKLSMDHPQAARGLVPYLDRLAAASPSAAYDVLAAAGDAVDGFKRALDLVDRGVLPAVSIAGLAYSVGSRKPHAEEFRDVIARLVKAHQQTHDAAPRRAGLQALSVAVHFKSREPDYAAALALADVKHHAWALVNADSAGHPSEAHDWETVVEWLFQDNPAVATRLIAHRLISGPRGEDGARELLVGYAGAYSKEVMDAFGEVLLDEQHGWQLQVEVYHDLVASIPAPVVIDWLRRHGVEGARRLARHLPAPQVSSSGQLVVPEALEFVLTEFEDDDDVFNNFVTGCHGFESWWGDASGRLTQEAAEARKFLSHPLRRIREWARMESEQRHRVAHHEQQAHAEMFVE